MLGGRGGLGGVVVVVGRCVEGVSCVVARHAAWIPEWCGGRDGLRVVVGSRSRWSREAGCGLAAEAFVVERFGADARLGTRRCGSGRVVAFRPCCRNSVRTLETGCVDPGASAWWRTLETGCVGCGQRARRRALETGCAVGREDVVGCERVTFSSGSVGVDA
jgi:hypothetical protein